MNSDTRSRLRHLLTPLHDDARAFARRLCHSAADGDDVFQDAVVRAMRRLRDLRDVERFRPWFYRIIITVARTRYRRSFWRRLVPLAGAEPSQGNTPLEAVSDRDGADRVRRALASLSSVQREAVVLFELEGFTVEEVAAIQEVTPSAVKSRLSRGRQKLRTIYIKRYGRAVANTPLIKGTTP